jgi:hypothetical protein
MKYLSLIFILIIPSWIVAQTEGYSDKLLLKNGSILYGKVLKFNGSDTLEFALSDKYTMTFYGKQVSKTVKKVVMHGEEKKSSEIFQFADPGLYFRTQLSLLYSKPNNGYSLSVSGGYSVKPWLSLGIGGGIDNYYAEEGYDMYPVFAEARVYFYKKNLTPYFAMRSGYAFASPDEDRGQIQAQGSWFYNPVLGLRLGGGKPHVDLFAGVRLQSAFYETLTSQFRSEREIDFRRYDFGVGINF